MWEKRQGPGRSQMLGVRIELKGQSSAMVGRHLASAFLEGRRRPCVEVEPPTPGRWVRRDLSAWTAPPRPGLTQAIAASPGR